MRKSLVAIGVGILAIPVVALAVPTPKVFVCKYVGKPGVNETLQTGQNPISVSENAIANFQGVGSYFNDAQGRSFVLAVDSGQPDPDVSECPKPQTPPVTPPTTPPVTETPKTETPATSAQDTPVDIDTNPVQLK